MLKFTPDPGNDRVFFQLSKADDKTKRGIRQGFFRLGARLKLEMNRAVLAKNKSGRVYIRTDRSGRRRLHRASAPGQTPANRTGNYRRNIGFQIRGSKQLEFGVRNGAKYAVFLEKGTSRMKPRPGVGNAVKATTRDARNFFESSLQTELINF